MPCPKRLFIASPNHSAHYFPAIELLTKRTMEWIYRNGTALHPDANCLRAMKRLGQRPSNWLLTVSVAKQRMRLFQREISGESPGYRFRKQFVISTSRFGMGQVNGSQQTPLGLHRIAKKIGAGQPIGTVFKSRKPIGLTWAGLPDGAIAHRILWLEGLESGFNRGGEVDTLERFIYIHGFADETTLGRPQSLGCIHLSATDLVPLFDRVPVGSMVWISER